MSMRLGAVLASYFFLWPFISSPHLSGQTIPDYEVYAIEYNSQPDWDVTGLLRGAEDQIVVDGSLMVWLIKDPEGRNILVDTGYLPDNPRHSDPTGELYTRPDEAVARLGVAPEDITDIIITHLHWDHADGTSLFPNAHFWIQEAELEYYATRAYQEGGDSRGVDRTNVVEIVELNTQGRVTLVDGDDQEIFNGVTLYTGGRHTFAAQYVGVGTPDGNVILASDNIWFYANLDLNLTNSLTFDPEADVVAQARMIELAGKPEWIIPGHDGAVFERFPNPVEGVARIR
jgi:glyoxylase-like metal-dependent hydrolase (beta-lactamase superfamily II)